MIVFSLLRLILRFSNGAFIEFERFVDQIITVAKSDVLIILDACLTGRARRALRKCHGKDSTAFEGREIHLLCASNGPTSRDGGSTAVSGPYTFTKLLTQVLRDAARDLRFGSTHDVRSRISALYDEHDVESTVASDTISQRGEDTTIQLKPVYNNTFR